jgi:MoxR-like ATPase
MTWEALYRGDGVPRQVTLPPAPPWRVFPRAGEGPVFQPPDGLIDAVNAALRLRRPLLVTGAPGSGKSTLIDSVAHELRLGEVLRWHVTSRSTLTEALYRYDALGRIHAHKLDRGDDIAPFLRLGPLGTALLPADRPRALLIDEIDKSDVDLPSDLLDVLERGTFEIPELSRHEQPQVSIREWESADRRTITGGRVSCAEFPFIVLTSNGERDFPAPFLRRCIRFTMPTPTTEMVGRIVAAHLTAPAANGDDSVDRLIQAFVERVQAGENLAVDQLLNAVYLLSGDGAPTGEVREQLRELILRELSHA